MHVPTTCNTLGCHTSPDSHCMLCAAAGVAGPSFAAEWSQGVLITTLLDNGAMIAGKEQRMLMAADFGKLPCKVLWRLSDKEIPDEAAIAELGLADNTKVILVLGCPSRPALQAIAADLSRHRFVGPQLYI